MLATTLVRYTVHHKPRALSARKFRASASTNPSAVLSSYASRLTFDAIPTHVVEKTKDLFVDWLACAIAGRGHRAVSAMEAFVGQMGASHGPSELLFDSRLGKATSPYWAALLNGASGHVVEQDDLHNPSIVHPAAVVFPAALATAQAEKRSGSEFLTAAVAGYEVACRVGEFLGKSHYRIFHTTGTAGTLGAAVATGRLLNLDPDQMLHALGSAGTQAAGLWQFLADAADSKQLHTAKANADGLLAAYTAKNGMQGASDILTGKQGMAAGFSTDSESGRLTTSLGKQWKVAETSFKWHASCRHTHPSADALQALMIEHSLSADDIQRVNARTYQAAIDVLGPAEAARTVHQSKFSMGFVLGVIATKGSAHITDFTEEALNDQSIRRFQERVEMTFDNEIEAQHPQKWIGLVQVITSDGRKISKRIDDPKGDPGNSLSREEISTKAYRMIQFAKSEITRSQLDNILTKGWNLETEREIPRFTP